MNIKQLFIFSLLLITTATKLSALLIKHKTDDIETYYDISGYLQRTATLDLTGTHAGKYGYYETWKKKNSPSTSLTLLTGKEALHKFNQFKAQDELTKSADKRATQPVAQESAADDAAGRVGRPVRRSLDVVGSSEGAKTDGGEAREEEKPDTEKRD